MFLSRSHHETGTRLVKLVMILIPVQVCIITANQHEKSNAYATLEQVQISTAILGKAA